MPLIDYLVLTPLDEEWRSIRPILIPEHSKKKLTDPVTYTLWSIPVDREPDVGGDYLMATASISNRTPGQSRTAAFTDRCLREWIPSRVFLLGIAGSLEPDRLHLGDVIVSDQIFGYEVGEAVDKPLEDLEFRRTYHQPDVVGLDRIRDFRNDPNLMKQWQHACMDAGNNYEGLPALKEPPNLHVDSMASGNYVVKSLAFAQKLKKEIDLRVRAVEMEAMGLHHALYYEQKCKNSLMIRGISDYADEHKSALEAESKDSWRAYAAGNTARLLNSLLAQVPEVPVSAPLELNVAPGTFERFQQKGIPRIGMKRVGAQNLAYPQLLSRHRNTPALTITVRATRGGQVVIAGKEGLLVLHQEQPATITCRPNAGNMVFHLPPSEAAFTAELLLRFDATVDSIAIACFDEFGRRADANI